MTMKEIHEVKEVVRNFKILYHVFAIFSEEIYYSLFLYDFVAS